MLHFPFKTLGTFFQVGYNLWRFWLEVLVSLFIILVLCCYKLAFIDYGLEKLHLVECLGHQ